MTQATSDVPPIRRCGRMTPVAAACLVALATQASAAAPLALTAARADDEARIVPLGERAMPYLVRLRAPSLVEQRGGAERTAKPDLRSREAQAYLATLEAAQDAFAERATRVLGRSIEAIAPQFRFAHAYNGMAIRLTAAEAQRLAGDAEVRSITPLARVPLHTDQGPRLIGATQLWSAGGTLDPDRVFGDGFEAPLPGAGSGNRGEGVVAGVIDSGLNFDHPSFAAQAGDGYVHENPSGDGRYLGLCADGNDAAPTTCNAKVIGAYDFVDVLLDDIRAFDPGATDGVGAEDENGHGSHTAGTLAGNPVQAQVPGGPALAISGVAPRANLVVYDACYTPSTGPGSCLNVSLVAAINQAVADGVDVVNYSIGGGADPWGEDQSLAFLAAAQGDVFVSTSAGNAGPSASSLSHLEPWVSTAAATSHTRGPFANTLDLTGPEPVPAELTGLLVTFPTDSVKPTAPIAGPLAYDAVDPLQCAPAAAGSLAGKIVMIRRGTCTFVIKVQNAQAGGASAVILVNTNDAVLNPALAGTTIPVGTVPKTRGDAIAAFHADHGDATARFNHPAQATASVPDRVARFSSRGPNDGPLLKPDLAAPGMDVVAPLAGDAGSYGVLSGTSMASPHVAGAAALLRRAHPGWSASEIKSALMMTAKTALTLEETGAAAASPQRGASRIQVDLANRTGLVLHEAPFNYLLADPAAGGVPQSLNLASLGTRDCVDRCVWARRFESVADAPVTWSLASSGIALSITPSTFTSAPGAQQSVTFQLDADTVPLATYGEGEVTLTPSDARYPALHLPVSAHVAPPKLAADTTPLSVTVPRGEADTVSFALGNVGNGVVSWAALAAGVQRVPTVNQFRQSNNGLVSSVFDATDRGALVADDFTLKQTVAVKSLLVEGFQFGPFGATLDQYADALTWSIYADQGGVPAGIPGAGGAAPLWTYTSAPDGPGVTPATVHMGLDLDAASQALTLGPGRYWLVAYPTYDAIASGVWWYRFVHATRNGLVAKATNTEPDFGGDPDNPAWEDIALDWPGHYDAAMVVTAEQPCGAPWLSIAPAAGAIAHGEEDEIALTIDAGGLAAGEHYAEVCIETTDPTQPFVLVPVHLTVSP